MTYEFDQEAAFERQTERYRRIDEANHDSFLMNEEASLQVIQSLHSAGARRDALTPGYAEQLSPEVVKKAAEIGRRSLAGNMSPLNGYGPSELSVDERIDDAKRNLENFFRQYDVDPSDVRMLRPERDYETPLTIIDVDEASLAPDDAGLLRPDQAGDFIYTYSPDTVLAARPADCPIVYVSAETPKGEVVVLLHLAWMGVANGYVEQAKAALDNLEVNWETVRAQITPGGQAKSFQFENFNKYNPLEKFPESKTMFVDVERVADKDGLPTYNFAIDLPGEVYEQLIDKWGVDPYQVFLDTSDTTSPTAGYSSHSRSFRKYSESGENSRDIVLAKRHR